MGRGFVTESADMDGLRAGATLRWLDNSGPRYLDKSFTVAAQDEDEVRLIPMGGGDGMGFSPAQLSYASWSIASQAAIGRVVTLKIRTDPVGREARQ